MELIFLAICALVWLLPLIIISRSSATSGQEKMAWILAVLLSPGVPLFSIYSWRLSARIDGFVELRPSVPYWREMEIIIEGIKKNSPLESKKS